MGKQTFNRGLRLLCEQPNMIGETVIAISASGLDQLKVSVARLTRDDGYTEVKTKVFDDSIQATYYARLLAKTIHTYNIYEIRVFRDDSVEFIRIIDEPGKKWMETKDVQAEVFEIENIMNRYIEKQGQTELEAMNHGQSMENT